MRTEKGKSKTAPGSRARDATGPASPPSSSRSRNATHMSSHKTTPAKPENLGGRANNSSASVRPPYYDRPLEAASILNNPRLQQVTGLHPRKISWLKGVHLPEDELARLQWVMSLPDTYPIKRPKGNF